MVSNLVALVGLSSVVLSAAQAGLPSFVFPEEGDDYFSENIRGLKASLSEALGSGCLDSWPQSHAGQEIAVLFRHDSAVPSTSDHFIQYQMEQVAASRAAEAGFRSFEEEVYYQSKLRSAAQIWDWSHRQLDFVREKLPSSMQSKLKYVPLWSSQSRDVGNCDEVISDSSCAHTPEVDAFFFGQLSEKRKQLCEAVKAELNQNKSATSECVQGLFGKPLLCKICKAKVIWVDHSREGAVLEVHRIDPLLALGKAVVSAQSADELLDQTYMQALELTASTEIPRAVARLVADSAARHELEWKAYEQAKAMRVAAQPQVCQALMGLAEMAKQGLLERSHVLENYVVARKLNATNSTNSTNSSSPTPVPTPLPVPASSSVSPCVAFLLRVESAEEGCEECTTRPCKWQPCVEPLAEVCTWEGALNATQ